MPTISVRPATRTDRPAVVRVLGRAFQVEPVYGWVFPDAAQRERRLPLLMRALLTMHAGMGAVEVATAGDQVGDEVIGVAVWDGPGRIASSRLRLAASLPALIRAAGSDTARVAQLQALEKARPAEPHWYLFHLGADPDAQGRGVGSALLGSMLPRCDAAGLGAYLECKEANVPYYERVGFAVCGEVTLAGGELHTLTMWRPPAPR